MKKRKRQIDRLHIGVLLFLMGAWEVVGDKKVTATTFLDTIL